jgi:hypothetical protein
VTWVRYVYGAAHAAAWVVAAISISLDAGAILMGTAAIIGSVTGYLMYRSGQKTALRTVEPWSVANELLAELRAERTRSQRLERRLARRDRRG